MVTYPADFGGDQTSEVHRAESKLKVEREMFIDNLLVRIHFIIVVMRWTGPAPWELEFTFPGSLAFTFLVLLNSNIRGKSILKVDCIALPQSHLYYYQRALLSLGRVPSVSGNAHAFIDSTTSEQRGNNSKACKNFYLKDKARIWPRLSCMCHVRSASACAFPTSLPASLHRFTFFFFSTNLHTDPRKNDAGRLLYRQPNGPDPLNPREDLEDRPHAMGVGLAFSR